MHTQTNEDQIDREIQTEDWLIEDKAIQATWEDAICVSENPALPWIEKKNSAMESLEKERMREIAAENARKSVNVLSLNSFLKKTVSVKKN